MATDKQARRYMVTINNPFFTEDFEEIDINNIKNQDFNQYKLQYLEEDNVKDLFDFKYVKNKFNSSSEDLDKEKIYLRPFFKDINSISKYVEQLEHFKYCIFQLEKGEEEKTPHIQMFISFSSPKYFSTIKNYFPTAHIESAKGSNSQCRGYCSKTETRVDGPYELGTFSEIGSRSDVKDFLELVKAGVDKESLSALNPSLYLREINKIDAIRQNYLYETYKKQERDIHVTYIYGPPRSGKTSYVKNKYGFGNFYRVTNYNSSAFEDYDGEDVVVFDEFDSSFKITDMNNYLDRYPIRLPCRYANKTACFTQVYIISNLRLTQQYLVEQTTKPAIYDAFKSRIHEIIFIGKNHKPIKEYPVEKFEQVSIQKMINEELQEINAEELAEIF